MARATASRGSSSFTKRSPSGPWSVAPSPRTASEIRKPSLPLRPTTAVGWNWVNSRSASIAPAWRASSRPEPNEPGGLVVRDHSAAAPPVASSVALAWIVVPSSSATPPCLQDRCRAVAFEDVDAVVLDDGGRERAQDPAAGRAPARVDDPAPAVAALEAEREVAAAVGVELDAELLQLAYAGRGFVGQHLGCGACGSDRGPRSACPRGAAGASRRARAPRRRRPGPSRTRSRRAAARR